MPGENGLDQAVGQPPALAAIRLLGIAALVFVVAASFHDQPGPGTDGAALGVTLALVTLCASTAAAMWLSACGPLQLLALSVLAVLSAAALIGLQSSGTGFLGVFPALGVSALSLPARRSGLVAGIAAVAVAAAELSRGTAPIAGVVLNEFAVAAIYLLAVLARRLRDSNERTGQLLGELEQTRLAQAEAAVLAERQRVSREMHDVLAHSLSGLALNLESARLLAVTHGADPRVTAAVDRAHRLARSGLAEARDAIAMLRGDQIPGPDRLAELSKDFEQDTGTSCTVQVSGQVRDLGTDGRLTLYRTAQEALTNVRKHSRADRVTIGLGYEPDGTRLTIADSGPASGQTPPAAGGGGYGLTGMRERAELLGGSLTAGPAGAGFVVELWLPS